jgi:predicted enzyme related to lactoylglutathione lyase
MVWRSIVERTKTGEFNWVDLSVRDIESETRFYEGLFGWSHVDQPYGEGLVYRMFKTDGHDVAGISQIPADQIKQGRPSAWNSYLAAADVDAIAAKAAELGGEVIMPPTDVPDSGRFAGIKDPTGAYIFLWKPLQTDETIEYGPPGTLGWSELNTRDPQKAIDFYTKLLGWKVEPMAEAARPYWQVQVDGQGEGAIMPMPEMVPAEVPAYWLPYFSVTDARASTERATALGARVLVGPVKVQEMLWFSILSDPEGANFALMQPLMQ